MSIVIMGVTGCGKTVVGSHLAKELGWLFFDADDFHPPENICKMKSGVPLTDADRRDWLLSLNNLIANNENKGNRVVLACSALKSKYRSILIGAPPKPLPLHFIFLNISREVALTRLSSRKGHFMPASLVDSQFDILEAPATGDRLNAELPLSQVVDEAVRAAKREFVDD